MILLVMFDREEAVLLEHGYRLAQNKSQHGSQVTLDIFFCSSFSFSLYSPALPYLEIETCSHVLRKRG